MALGGVIPAPRVRIPPSPLGGVAERSNAAVSKTVSGLWVRRGFKSLPLRHLKSAKPLVPSAARRGVRAAEGTRLEIAYLPKGGSRVRIPPSPSSPASGK